MLGSDLLPAVGDIGGDALITGGKAVLPKEAEDAIAAGASAVAQSDIVQKGMEAWDEFEEASPDLARRVGQIGTIATTLAPGPKLKMPKKSLAKPYGRKRLAQDTTNRETEIRRLLTPDMDEDTTLRVTEEGLTGRRTYNPTEFEQDVIKEVRNLKTIDPKKSYQDVTNKLNDEVRRLADDLDNQLADVEMNAEEVYNRMINAVNEVGKHPAFVGDASESAVRMFQIFDEMLKEATKGKKTISARDLIEVRRRFDDELLNFQAPSAAFLNGRHIAGDSLRKKMNDIIIEAAPDVKVRESLDKQHRLLSARGRTAPRAAKEAGTAVGRMLDNFARHTGIHMPTTPLAVGATGMHAPTAAAMTALMAGYGLTRPLTRASRAAYHNALKAIDEVIAKGGIVAETLAADRQALLELTQQAISAEDEELE